MSSRIAIFGLVVLLVIGSLSVFTVSETEHAIRFRFREIIRDDFDPGLHFKLPWENVLKLDKRILILHIPIMNQFQCSKSDPSMSLLLQNEHHLILLAEVSIKIVKHARL